MSQSAFSAQEFEKNFNAGKTQLAWKWIPADLETPVSAFLKIANEQAYSFLLESVEGGEKLGRYSIIGLSPDILWEYKDGQISITHNGDTTSCNKTPIASLRAQLQASKIDIVPNDMPPMAVSGLFGYLGYDCVRLIEDIDDDNPDNLEIPESIMARPTILTIFDNVKNMMCIVTPVFDHAENSAQDAATSLKQALMRIDNVLAKLENALNIEKASSSVPTPLETTSNFTREGFHDIVHKAVDYIHAGDIFQVVLAQRFSCDFDLPAFSLYRSLRRLNPSPFLFFMNFDGFSLVGSSPEILVRLRDGKMTIRPIAGTRKRGQDAAEDQALAQDLLSDPKERSEHLMLLDLARNDIGRVANNGSVTVTDEFIIEYYSHVMHIVSNVEGELREGKDSLDALFAGFPHGTVSGAPKVRAMEIIEELETLRRSFYAGCVGYLSSNGDLDTCLALRTGLIKNGKLHVQAGAGVVADSDPEFEHQECINKSKAVLQAAEDAVIAAKNVQNDRY